jgi:diguanylate cyclase (GGDEF)-like protein
MIAPPPLADETRRLATLRRLDILDTPPEERFDRLTRLAKRLFDVPTALVTMIDEDRQWFKSSTGLTVAQTPREFSFCGHAIASDSILLVPDASQDPRFHDNPFVIGDPHVRFYVGCPLSTPNGSKIGTLCLIDSQPRDFDKESCALLSDLARMAEQEFVATELANLDELTGIPNRRAFKALGQQTLNQCHRARLPASMLFFDLDGFKGINDRFGHTEGDFALAAFATTLVATFCESDVIGRIGGDEFAALLWNCSAEEAVNASGRVQRRLDAHNQTATRGYDIRFSAGRVTSDPSKRCVVEAMLAEADTLMYENKRSRWGMRSQAGDGFPANASAVRAA